MGEPTRTQPADPSLPPPTARRTGDGERAVLACLVSGPRQCREIGGIIGRGASEVRRTMGKLVRMGAAVEVAPSCYAATAEAHALVDARAGTSRVILAFLAAPRRIGEIAQHTGAPRGTVRGRVDMLVCTGQAAKLGRGLYLATGRPRAMPDLPAALPAAPSPCRGGRSRSATRSWPFWMSPAGCRTSRPISAGRCRTPRATSSRCSAGAWWCAAHGRYERVEPILELMRLAATAGAWAGSGHVDTDVAAADSPTPISAGGTELPRAP